MTDRKKALEALLEKVKAGTLTGADCCISPMMGWFAHSEHDIIKSYWGDMNAAKALHDAALPGWGWEIYDEGCARVWPRPLGDAVFKDGINEKQARAWLIAILSALIEQEGE